MGDDHRPQVLARRDSEGDTNPQCSATLVGGGWHGCYYDAGHDGDHFCSVCATTWATVESPQPSFVQPAVIERFAALEEGWDGYGAQPPTEPALDVLRALSVVPCTDGGVQIDIYVNGWETEIVFSPEGRPICFLSEASTKEARRG